MMLPRVAAWRLKGLASPPRGEALPMAYRRCGITMTPMAAELGLSVSRISRLIAAAERSLAP